MSMKREQAADGQKKIIEVHYYNVVIYVEINGEEEDYLLQHLKNVVTAREKITLKHILSWCKCHHLKTETKFCYRWDFPPHANLFNLAAYCRVLWEMSRESE